MSPKFDLCGVFVPASIKTRKLEAQANGNMGWRQVLNMKIVYALPKNLRFMISFDPEPQSRVQAPQSLLQTLINVLGHQRVQVKR